MKITKRYQIFLGFLSFYLLLFFVLIHGVGNYWDWNFPYFNEQWISAFFSQQSSWLEDNLGGPLSYHSWYYFRLIFHLVLGVSKLPTEIFLYLFLVALFTIGTYLVFLLLKKKVNSILAIMLSFGFFLNPAIFYKLLAGHINYLVSYVILIGLIYFIFSKYEKNFKSAIILGLLLAFTGIQIQLIVIAILFISIYFLFYREKFSLGGVFLSFGLAFIINLPWLSNFLIGANNIGSVSQAAESVSFYASSHASLPRIFAMIFSPATVIQYVYDFKVLAYFGLFFLAWLLLAILYLVKTERKKENIFLLVISFLFIFLGSGKFHDWNFLPLKIIAPIFREIGHFAPIIILFCLLSFVSFLGSLTKSKFLLQLVTGYFVVFVAINAYYFVKFLPRVDYKAARDQFNSFVEFEKSAPGTYRILSYPFFNQYGFNNTADVVKNGRLLNNSGWDNYILNSSKDSILNYATASNFHNLVQYKLLEDFKIDPLRKLNVKYIYDFQKIYTSNFEQYTEKSTYDNNLSLIKNDPSFLDRLIAANPGKLAKVRDDILVIEDYLPRLYSKNLTFQKVSNTYYKLSFKGLGKKEELTFLESFHEGWALYPEKKQSFENCQLIPNTTAQTTECFSSKLPLKMKSLGMFFKKPLPFNHQQEDHYNKWEIDPKLIDEDYYHKNEDGTVDIDMALYFTPQKYFVTSLLISALATLASILGLLYITYRKGVRR